ncbi:DoxX family protein [Pseudoxanthomonas sp. UTMC 1351]|uniref:DoxX family protein n=1 Tax=Pseudoxanthomonas sp. UTMC 1351 TaxID=2695853 RepID=UPI0034CD7500
MASPISTAQLEVAVKPPLLSSALALCARILIATIFVLSGMSKLADPSGTISYIASVGLPLPTSGFILAVFVEIFGGAALILGYRTRWIASVLAIFSVAAAVAFHNQFGDQNQFTHFLKNLAIAGGLLQVTAFGPGNFSLDGRR